MPYGNWVEITPALPIPPARRHGGMAFDRLNNKVLLFGGNDGVTPRLDDSWHYTPGTTSWHQLSPAAKPSARYGHACCDTVDGVHVFGGNAATLQQDLWKYATSNWVLQPSAGDTPPVREFAAMAWCPSGLPDDPILLMWGGDTGGDFDKLIWVYSPSASEWFSFESYANPAPRCKHSLYYDPERDRVILFGGLSLETGVPLNDLWECDGKQWLPLTTLKRPTARQAWQAMAFDTRYHRAVVAPIGIGAQGTIDTYGGQLHKPGDSFVLDDGLHATTTFEIVPIRQPTDVIRIGEPPTSLRFDLTSLFATGSDPTGSIDHSGTAIYLKCNLTGNVQSATSAYIGGVNYVDSTDLMGQGIATLSTQTYDYRVGLAPGLGNEIIEADRKATANQMRDLIAAAINNVGSGLDITAYGYEDAKVHLFNDRADPNGNTTSITMVTVAGFLVSDMTGAETESWSYNRSGGLWLEHPEASPAPVLDGGMLIFDPFAYKFVLYGGEKEGTLQDKQYEWQWSDVGLSPLYSLPGGFQGRLKPVMTQATDGSWSFILGADLETLPDFLLDIGDKVQLKQEITVGGQKLLRFDWRMRYSGAAPKYTVLVDPVSNPVSTSFRTTGLLKPTVPPADNVIGIRLAQPLFKSWMANQLCRITGADVGVNDGTYRITDVPSNIGEVNAWGAGGAVGSLQAGMVAVVENGAMVHSLDNTGVKLEVLGAQWRAQMYIDDGSGTDVLVAELVERRVQADPDGWQRGSLAAHISKLSAVTTITFVLQLESVDQP